MYWLENKIKVQKVEQSSYFHFLEPLVSLPPLTDYVGYQETFSGYLEAKVISISVIFAVNNEQLFNNIFISYGTKINSNEIRFIKTIRNDDTPQVIFNRFRIIF